MLNSKALLVGCIAMCSSSMYCFGWGEAGHRIVGEIAWQELSPAARAAVQAILETDPETKYHTLAGASLWADDIKPRFRELHYADAAKGSAGFDFDRDCPESGCVVSAILDNIRTLEDTDAGATERLEAVKFLAHFIGDVHQPLHVGYLEDRGGNDINVRFFNASKKLHGVWDTNIIARVGKEWKAYANELKATITNDEREGWQSADPVEWANESYQLAVHNAYVLPRSRKIGQAYFDKNRPIVEQRLKAGGVRLATILSAVFADEADDSLHEMVIPTRARATPIDRPAVLVAPGGRALGDGGGYRTCLSQAADAMREARSTLAAAITDDDAERAAVEVYLETYRTCLHTSP